MCSELWQCRVFFIFLLSSDFGGQFFKRAMFHLAIKFLEEISSSDLLIAFSRYIWDVGSSIALTSENQLKQIAKNIGVFKRIRHYKYLLWLISYESYNMSRWNDYVTIKTWFYYYVIIMSSPKMTHISLKQHVRPNKGTWRNKYDS